MIDRRGFLFHAGLTGVNLAMLPLVARAADKVVSKTPEEAAQDEDYWAAVRGAFRLDGRFADLQGHAVASAPSTTLDEMARTVDVVHSLPAYHLFRYGQTEKDRVRARLASVLGAEATEVALVRNTTEGISTLIRGLEVELGDEVVTTDQDYPPFIRAWQARGDREQFRVRVVSLPNEASDDQLVEQLANAVTDRTSVLMACHVLFRSGRVLPMKRICAMARERRVRTVIDGAHGFGHVPTDVSQIGCDYYANSLHKWALGPVGTGVLYIREELIAETPPLFMPWDESLGDNRIEKFEDPGTSLPAWPAVNASLDFLEAIGLPRKFARHAYLTRYWSEQLDGVQNVTVRGIQGPTHGGGFASLRITGVESRRLFRHLLDRHRILVGPGETDIKIASQVYTRPADLDALVAVIKRVARNGL